MTVCGRSWFRCAGAVAGICRLRKRNSRMSRMVRVASAAALPKIMRAPITRSKGEPPLSRWTLGPVLLFSRPAIGGCSLEPAHRAQVQLRCQRPAYLLSVD